MREYVLYMWLGVWLFLLPFFGIPGSWKNALVMLTALFVAVHSFIGYRKARPVEDAEAVSGAEEHTTESQAGDTASARVE